MCPRLRRGRGSARWLIAQAYRRGRHSPTSAANGETALPGRSPFRTLFRKFALTHRQTPSLKSRLLAAIVLFWSVCLPPESGLAQSDSCVLSPDKYHPDEQILRCGAELTIRPAPGSVYRPTDAGPGRPPASIQLDGGALLIIFHSTTRRRDFQILTPQAIASVRGTTWAVEVKPGETSVFVVAGVVGVARTNAATGVVLRRGQGVDVNSEGGPLQVKRWSPARIRALLARFGR